MNPSSGTGRQVPLPPEDFMTFVGSRRRTPEATLANYLETGIAARQALEEVLGPDWDWQGKRLLDFGCGAGRLLREILDWAEVGEVHGSDLDRPMVEWARENLCPPVAGVELNGVDPPLSYPDDHFDVVSAFSVFTHLGANWADWLLELRRILKPDGYLVATILDQPCAEEVTSVAYSEDGVGMSISAQTALLAPYVNVVHSHWWIREHWGRAFEILSITPGQVGSGSDSTDPSALQGMVVARPRPGQLDAFDLRRENPEEERYVAAQLHQLEMFRVEAEELKERFRETEMRLALLEDSHRDALQQIGNQTLRAKVRRVIDRIRSD